jgi:hypothetical protein
MRTTPASAVVVSYIVTCGICLVEIELLDVALKDAVHLLGG